MLRETQRKIVEKCGFIVFKMTAQNTQSEQKKLQHSRLQSGREIYEKLSAAGGLVWLGDFGMCVFCAVILNTINPYFLTIFFGVPPLPKKISDANPPISKYFFSKKNLEVLLLCIKTTQKKFRLIKKVKILIFTTT